MFDLHEQMRMLSQQIANLKPQLGEVAGQYAELSSDLAPFIQRFQKTVKGYHDELIAIKREIADMKALKGDSSARDAGDIETPLSRFSTPGGLRSVQEQYDRVWKGKTDPTYTGPDLPPASPELQKHFAEVVAAYHPNLTDSAGEKMRRREAIKRAYRAYVRRDKVTLHGMASMVEQRSNLPAMVDESVVQQLRDQVQAMEDLIAQIESQNAEMLYGDLSRIKAYADVAAVNGEDLLVTLKQEIQEELDKAHRELSALKYAS